MKVKIIKNIITATLPQVSIGDMPIVSEDFGQHLIEIGAAEPVADYEKKVIETPEETVDVETPEETVAKKTTKPKKKAKK